MRRAFVGVGAKVVPKLVFTTYKTLNVVSGSAPQFSVPRDAQKPQLSYDTPNGPVAIPLGESLEPFRYKSERFSEDGSQIVYSYEVK
jgi:hypothetical protein